MFNKQKKTKKVVNREFVDDKSKKGRPSSVGSGFYYSFLTVILLLCLFQITISAILNISKIVSYKAKIVQITKTRDAAMALNDQLKDNIKNFSNVAGMEAIARNNLKMSGEDEVLVIINTPKEEPEAKPEKFSLFGLKK
jgi:cell division protein FtsB